MAISNGIYRAMGDDDRRSIVRLVAASGPVRVDDITERTGATDVTLHHVHLPMLEYENIIEVDNDGLVHRGEWFDTAIALVDPA